MSSKGRLQGTLGAARHLPWLLLVVGLIAIPLGLGGNFVLLGAALLVAAIGGFSEIGWIALVILLLAVVLGEVIEALLGSLVAQKFGASRWGVIGAFAGGIIGAIVGTPIFPLVGSLIGSFAGAALGAVGLELAAGKDHGPGLRAGWGAFRGKVMATAFKVAVGMAIVSFVVWKTHFYRSPGENEPAQGRLALRLSDQYEPCRL